MGKQIYGLYDRNDKGDEKVEVGKKTRRTGQEKKKEVWKKSVKERKRVIREWKVDEWTDQKERKKWWTNDAELTDNIIYTTRTWPSRFFMGIQTMLCVLYPVSLSMAALNRGS